MLMTLKALSALLSYPTPELQQAKAEIAAVIRAEGLLPPALAEALDPLLDEIADSDIYEVQERFVSLFDRSRTLSLNLFEHVHGESRDRGPAMVDLVETYRAGGFDPATSELPDHLPVLLEFLATRPLAEARETLADAAHILEALSVRLARRESTYAAVFTALVHLSSEAADAEALGVLLAAKDDDPNDLAALDEVWEESEVTFGPGDAASGTGGGCPQVRDVLAGMGPGKKADWATPDATKPSRERV